MFGSKDDGGQQCGERMDVWGDGDVSNDGAKWRWCEVAMPCGCYGVVW